MSSEYIANHEIHEATGADRYRLSPGNSYVALRHRMRRGLGSLRELHDFFVKEVDAHGIVLQDHANGGVRVSGLDFCQQLFLWSSLLHQFDRVLGNAVQLHLEVHQSVTWNSAPRD